MITEQLLHPKSIVVVGASNNIHKPGGAILQNLINGKFEGRLIGVNPKETMVQGVKSYAHVREIPPTDLAVLAIPAAFCPETVEILAKEKETRAFVILSAGFGEESHEGEALERSILDTVNRYKASLIGPNCIGLLTTHHHSVFSRPVPELDPKGADLISGSGATAVFILESAIAKGLRFNSVWSVGNAKQIGVEDVLEYMDEHFDAKRDSLIKLLYIENIGDPQRLLKHASSLIRKGCRIAAIKAGSSESGSRAASSHTGAIASSDSAVDALLRKAGVVRCYSREELTTMGCIFTLPKLEGKNIAIITHAGGPGVMLTDVLSKGGLNIPKIEGPKAQELKEKLFPGAAVGNPIDVLATGTPDHLALCLDYCEKEFNNIDAVITIFGTPGLVTMFDMYRVLAEKMRHYKKPVYPIFPSIRTAAAEVEEFIGKGFVGFPDEVMLGSALARLAATPAPAPEGATEGVVDIRRARSVVEASQEEGYLAPSEVVQLLEAAGIPVAREFSTADKKALLSAASKMGYPVVAKVVGPLHKSDCGGVLLNIPNEAELSKAFDHLMSIKEATGVLIQPMLSGMELFIGAKYESRFGHILLCGLGGIFVEVLKDVASALAPLSKEEAVAMIRSLRGYRMIKGVRGQKGVDEERFAEILVRLSALLQVVPEIKEMDINPLLGSEERIVAVDARIRIGR